MYPFTLFSATQYITETLMRAYTLDVHGNHTRMNVTGSENYRVEYTYNFNNQLTRELRVPSSGPQSDSRFTYDRNGNQLTRTTATGQPLETKTYNAFNQLVSVSQPAAVGVPAMSATYIYRADGLRHAKTINGEQIFHIWDMGNIVLESNTAGEVINRYYRGIGGRLILSDNHGWYLHNVRGDVVQRTNAQGNVVHSYSYDAFGNEINPEARNTNPFRYAGEYFDFETGNYYLRARHFNPRTGRFMQEDSFWGTNNMQSSPNAIMQSGNLYMYVMHNPIMWRDPLGLFAWNESNYQWIFVNEQATRDAGGTFTQTEHMGVMYATLNIWGVQATFRADGGGVISKAQGLFAIRANTFYSTIVGAAGGEMTFLGGHKAFNLFNVYHMHIAMFVSPISEFYDIFQGWRHGFARWGLRFAFISGTAGGGRNFSPYIQDIRTVGQLNVNYMERANLQFWNHLSSDVGMVQQLVSGYFHFMTNHRYTFPYNFAWTNSTSFTIGLVNAVGLNHGLSSEQVARAWGINNAFAPRYFGR